MGENEKLGFPIYFPSQPMCNDVGSAPQAWNGSQMPSAEYCAIAGSSDAKFLPPPNYPQLLAVCEDMKKKLLQELGGKPHEVKFDIPNCKVSYKDDKIVVDELTTISEETAKAFEKSCNDYLETLSEVSKSLNPCLERLIAQLTKPTKRKKHYKPKFTL